VQDIVEGYVHFSTRKKDLASCVDLLSYAKRDLDGSVM
jgi:hypothetical protein